MLTRRIIPCLDVDQGRVVKGTKFLELRDAGDPVESAVAYNNQGADELVFLDITASSDGRGTIIDVVERTAARLMAQHGGRIERAFRRDATHGSEEPFEVHLVAFPNEEAFAAYRDDARTLALKEQRERLIARTEIWRGNEINYGF